MITLPGLIDIHVHLRTPGQTYKEDFLTGTSAAIAGGFTTIFDMPNNKTPIASNTLLDEKMKLAQTQTVSNIGFYFGSLGDNLDEFEKVKTKAFGIKLYLNETTGNFLINEETLGNIYNAWFGGSILVHAEDDAVSAVIQNVERTRKATHFCHISLKSDLEQIMRAKERGLPVTCGVTPHHLFLTQEDSQKLGPFGTMKPYLKSANDVSYLWKNIQHIDVIESDHAPHTKEEKENPSDGKSPFGVPGLETTLPLLLTAVNQEKLTIDDIKRLCHTNPKKILKIPNIETGMIYIDMDEEYVIDNNRLFTKCAWSPFNGWQMQGKVKKVTIENNTVFENGNVLTKPGSGRVITPAV